MLGQDWTAYGLGFMLALVLALWSVFHIAQSAASPMGKAIWIVLVLFVPYIGFLLWLVFGPKRVK